jgi:transposase-like protein
MQVQQESTTLTPCPKCHSGMFQVAITPHPVSSRMLRHTYVCRTCNQTRTYMLPTPPVAEEIYAGTSSRQVDLMVA